MLLYVFHCIMLCFRRWNIWLFTVKDWNGHVIFYIYGGILSLRGARGGVKDVLNARGLIVPGWAQGVMYTALCTLLYFVFEFVFEKIRFTEASFESMSFLPIF